jgi:Integrase core domain
VDLCDALRLKKLDDENSELKKLLADCMLDNLMFNDINLKNDNARCKVQAAAYLLIHHEVSQRRACSVLEAARSVMSYHKRKLDDAVVRTRLLAGAESFNGKAHDQFLNESLFTSIDLSRSLLAAWKNHYSHNRPHSKLGSLTPVEFAQSAASVKTISTGAAILEI